MKEGVGLDVGAIVLFSSGTGPVAGRHFIAAIHCSPRAPAKEGGYWTRPPVIFVPWFMRPRCWHCECLQHVTRGGAAIRGEPYALIEHVAVVA